MLLISCVSQPTNPVHPKEISKTLRGAYILCEGLYGHDNSTLVWYDFGNRETIENFYSIANPGLKLGDTSNDIVIKGDTALVVVSTAMTIEAFEVKTGKFAGRIKLSGNRFPRHICIVSDTVAYVTDAYDNSIEEFNPRTISLTGVKISVGPQPEEIVNFGNYLFVANSGWGDINYRHPKAGTISVIDLKQKLEVNVLDCGKNTVELKINRSNGKLYALYYNLPSLKDSVGGIVEFDAATLERLRTFRISATDLSLSATGDTLFFLEKEGVGIIDLTRESPKPELIIANPVQTDIWYALSVSYNNNNIWVGNAKNYQVNGEVLAFDLTKPALPILQIKVGVNPNTIVFY